MKKTVIEIKSNKEIQVEMLRDMLRGSWFNEEFEIEDVFPHTCRLTEARAREMLDYRIEEMDGSGLDYDKTMENWRHHNFITAPEQTALEKVEIKKLIIIEDYNVEFMIKNTSAVCNKLNEVIDYLNKQAIKEEGK